MCGIGGILRVQQPDGPILAALNAIPEAWLDIIDDSIKHRGPDGHGRFRDRATRPDGSIVDIALVHRRLSIIDHTSGHQPMLLGASVLRTDTIANRAPRASVGSPSPDNSQLTNLLASAPYHQTQQASLSLCPCCGESALAVVFNGCIYNHRELRTELQALGHTFTTDHSDTEVLLHGYRQWQADLANHLDGMYSFAIWDAIVGDVVLSSDLAHEKRNYLVDDLGDLKGSGSLFAFASVPAALTRLQAARSDLQTSKQPVELHATIAEDWLADWVRFGGSDEPAAGHVSHWPAHAMVHSSVQCNTRDWNFKDLPDRNKPHPPEPLTADKADALIERATHSRLVSDVEVGCFLSGGIDSALIAHHAQKELGNLRTFTVAMPDDHYDESKAAAETAKHIGTDHETLDCNASPASDLVHLIRQLGLPLGDSSLLPTYWVSKATRQAVKVCLSGDGGDELFAGYQRHVAAIKLQRFAPLVARLPRGLLPDRDPKGKISKARRMVSAARLGYHELTAIFQMPDLRRLMPGVDFGFYQLGPMNEKDPPGNDFWNYLQSDVLRKVDTASMSVALEVRAPFLSTELVHACLQAPLSELMPGGQRKGLLRQVARKHLPAEIVDRPKMGFAIPIGDWFRTDFGSMRQLLNDHLLAPEPFGPDSLGINAMIDMKFVHRMLNEHDAAGEGSRWPWHGRDHSQRLYMLLVLSIWSKWLGSLSPPD